MSTPTLPRESALLIFVAYAIGLVLLMTAGIYDGPLAEPALLIVLASLAIVVFAFVRLLAKRPLAPIASRPVLCALLVGLAVFAIATFADARLLIDTARTPTLIHVLALASVLLFATYVPALVRNEPESKTWKDLRFALFGAIWVMGGISVMHLSPSPHIDVWHVHTQGAAALLHGENPYVAVHVVETGPVNVMPTIAFVYPPTPCYVNTLAYALGGDVRWGMLAGWLAAGVAMRFIARGSGLPAVAEDAPALLLWVSPKAFFILEQSWNDAYPIAFVSLAILAHVRRRPYLAAIFLGLALSSKQTMVWFVPLAFLLAFDVKQWATFLGTALATAMPFFIWDFHAFRHWMIDGYVGYPPRLDALTPMNWLYRHFGVPQVGWPGLLLAAATSIIAALRAPRTPYAFALSATLACFVFYLFNRWMFVNYYYFVASLAALAAALGARRLASST